jgi:hypothetical protein
VPENPHRNAVSAPVPDWGQALEWRDHLILTALGIGLLGLLIALLSPLNYPFANDTAGYLQEARNWLRGEGFLRGTDWTDITREWAAFPLFPPGFAIEIAGLSKLGLSLPHAALAAAWLSWLLLLPAISYALRPLVGRWVAMAIAILAVSSPGFVEYGYLALSDAGMTLLSVLSLGILIRQSYHQSACWQAILLSGFLAGCAYSLRNAAAVLPLTVIAYLGLSLLTRQSNWLTTLRTGLIWGGGFALLAFPLFFYNFHTFGSIQPYFSAHGEVNFGAIKAFRVSLWSLLLDLSAWRAMADMAWSIVAMALLLPATLLLLWAGWQRWRRSAQAVRSALLLLSLYAGLGFALVVWGRSHFDWVEVTLTWQLMPYSWAVFAGIAWALQTDTPQENGSSRTHTLLLLGALLAAGRLGSIQIDLHREADIRAAVDAHGYMAAARLFPDSVLTNRIKQNTRHDHDLMNLLKSLPYQAHIVSNQAQLLSLETGRHIRSFDPTARNLTELAALRRHIGDRMVILAMLPTNAILRSAQADTWQDETLHQISSGYRILMRTPTVLVISLP